MAKFVQTLIDKAAVLSQMHGGYASKQELCGFLGTASIDLFNSYLPKRVGTSRAGGGPSSYQVNTYADRALNAFLKTATFAPFGNPDYAAPDDMVYPTALTLAGVKYPVDVLDDDQVVYVLNDEVFGPDKNFPKAEVLPNGHYRLYPTPTTALTIKYLALPPVPVYAQMLDATTNLVYDDANSVDVGWSRQYEMTLIQAILRLLAENTANGQLMQAANMLTQESL